MTITATTTTVTDAMQVLADDARALMRDYAPNNVLLDSVQFTDAEILRAIRLATGWYNTAVTPTSSVEWDLIPEYILLLKVTSLLLLSETFLQLRNQASIPTDGLGVIGIDDKWSQYLQLREQLASRAEEAASNYKRTQNLESAYGNMPSGYAYVGRYTR